MTARPVTGRCLCGATRFEAQGDPLSTNFCHCESCRRHGGGPAAAFVTFPKDTVRWSGAERAWYRSSPPVVRSFCGRCGSPLAYEHDNSADEVDLYLGAFDEPGRSRPASTPTMASASSGSTRSTIPRDTNRLRSANRPSPSNLPHRPGRRPPWAGSADHCPNSASIKKSAFCRHDPASWGWNCRAPSTRAR